MRDGPIIAALRAAICVGLPVFGLLSLGGCDRQDKSSDVVRHPLVGRIVDAYEGPLAE